MVKCPISFLDIKKTLGLVYALGNGASTPRIYPALLLYETPKEPTRGNRITVSKRLPVVTDPLQARVGIPCIFGTFTDNTIRLMRQVMCTTFKLRRSSPNALLAAMGQMVPRRSANRSVVPAVSLGANMAIVDPTSVREGVTVI